MNEETSEAQIPSPENRVRAKMFDRLFLACTLVAAAIAAPSRMLDKRAVTPLSSGDLAALAPFTQFARAAYCPTDVLKDWSCGGRFILISCLHWTLRWSQRHVLPCQDSNPLSSAAMETLFRYVSLIDLEVRCQNNPHDVRHVNVSLCWLLAGSGYRGRSPRRN